MHTIEMWHGGRNLEFDYREDKPSRNGKWEHGPGLYLTTSYSRAFKYAKGGGSTYLVKVESGNDLYDTFIPVKNAVDFVRDNAPKSLQKDIENRIIKISDGASVRAAFVLNNLINAEAIKSTKTVELQRFLVSQGVDYAAVKNYGGGNEDVLVVINKKKILSVTKVAANDLDVNMYDLPFEFTEQKRDRTLKI